MSRVVHFEIHAAEPARLIEFYSKLFGWNFQQWGQMDYWIINTGPDNKPGIHGGLVLRRGPSPVEGQAVNSFVCTIEIDSVDETLKQGVALGGTIAVPKMPIPTVGWLAYLKDTDGNILGVMQRDPQAK